jgi:hypothetical protein
MPLIRQTILGDLNDSEIQAATKYALTPLVLIQRLNVTIDEKAQTSHMDTVIPLETEAMVFHLTIHMIL